MNNDIETTSETLMDTMAPIILFVYNRPDKTICTVKALQENAEFKDSDLFVYCDGEKEESTCENHRNIEAVRRIIHGISGFKSIKIIERDRNYGLAQNIISAVTEVINIFGKAIVIEDDIVVGKYYLKYINEALQKYKNVEEVMEISGYVEQVCGDDFPQSMFIKNGYCWGWATWKDRWSYFVKNPIVAYNSMSIRDRYHFDIEGTAGKTIQIFYNIIGTLDTWAVFWDYAIFKKNGYVLVPRKSLVRNIGGDGTGEHQANNTLDIVTNIDFMITQFPDEISENMELRREIRTWYKRQKPILIKRLYHVILRRIIYFRNIDKFRIDVE